MEETRAQGPRAKQGHFCWLDLVAQDLDVQSQFYEQLFGWDHEDMPTDDRGGVYRMFSLAGATVAAASQITPEMGGVPTMWNAYVCADDVDAMMRRVADVGGQVVLPAMDVFESGRVASFADPTGGALSFWQPRKHAGVDRVGEPSTFLWSDLNTSDPAKAAEFYRALLGWQIDELPGGPMPYWLVTVDGQREAGIMPMPPGMPEGVPAHWLVYFGVNDVYVATEKVKTLGGTPQMDPMDVGTTVFSVFNDPAGATFALMTPPVQG